VAMISLGADALAVSMEEERGSYRYREQAKAPVVRYWETAQASAYLHYIMYRCSARMNMKNAAKRITAPAAINHLGDNPNGKSSDEVPPGYAGKRGT